jgi:hypothetical protein
MARSSGGEEVIIYTSKVVRTKDYYRLFKYG